MIEFVLPFCLESLNVRDRKSHWQRSRDKRNLSWEVMAALGGPRWFPRPPLRHVKVTIIRCSSGRLDKDNLWASCKGLLDCLCATSPRHPDGLGIIEDDRDGLLDLEVRQSTAPPGAGSTVVRIESIP
jgi:hypothetical protein